MGGIMAGSGQGAVPVGGLEEGTVDPFATPLTITSPPCCLLSAGSAIIPLLVGWFRAVVLRQTHSATGNEGQELNRSGVRLLGIPLKTFRLQTRSPVKMQLLQLGV